MNLCSSAPLNNLNSSKAISTVVNSNNKNENVFDNAEQSVNLQNGDTKKLPDKLNLTSLKTEDIKYASSNELKIPPKKNRLSSSEGDVSTFSNHDARKIRYATRFKIPTSKCTTKSSSTDKEINLLTNNSDSSSNNSTSPSPSTTDLPLNSGENVPAKTFDFIFGQPKTNEGTKKFTFELKTDDQKKNALSDEKPLDEDESLNLILRCIESLNVIISKAQKSKVIGIFDNSDQTDKNIIKSALVQLRLSPERASWINKCVFVNNQIPTSDFVIRKNIICTNGYDAQRYHAAIALSCLREDLKSFPNGDKTVVGKTSLQLTDAQKEKLALARAFYANKDIYFLDDILNSIDSTTGQTIFETSIKGALEDKIVIFITQNPMYLSRCDEIYVMKNGQINAQGSHESLLQSNAFYASKMNVTVDNNSALLPYDKSSSIEEVSNLSCISFFNTKIFGTITFFIIVIMICLIHYEEIEQLIQYIFDFDDVEL
ncbi:ATP-binding cassette sub-family C member 5-like [Microplitis mediator]|uniref:ATP-binding cassette sub-family C member 5-like n=1 Tax=Microplitis mediator TaxID=375433 RepID=UPI002557AA51|nr:ATP-binding cassette sub-family C member 5-like [Microplitis mediator]